MALDSEVLRLLLVFARVSPSVFALASFSRGFVPQVLAGSLALALSCALLPLAGQSMGELSLFALLTALLRELAIGGSFALALAFALLAGSWAVRLSHASSSEHAHVSPLASAYALCGCWLVLSLGGLRAFVTGLVESYRDAPLAGGAFDARAFSLGVLQLTSDAFAAAIGVALPLIASVWLVEVTSTLLDRVLPRGLLAAASPLRSFALVVVSGILLMPTAGRSPELVRAAIAAARALTRVFAK